jgi:hypothetical protein
VCYSLPVACSINLTVYDVAGRLAETLVDGIQEPGSYSLNWGGSGQLAGTYFCRLHAGGFTDTKKMILLR